MSTIRCQSSCPAATEDGPKQPAACSAFTPPVNAKQMLSFRESGERSSASNQWTQEQSSDARFVQTLTWSTRLCLPMTTITTQLR